MEVPAGTIVGIVFTVTVETAVFVHPFTEVPITENVVLELGAVVKDVVEFPVLHEYVLAPLPVNVIV